MMSDYIFNYIYTVTKPPYYSGPYLITTTKQNLEEFDSILPTAAYSKQFIEQTTGITIKNPQNLVFCIKNKSPTLPYDELPTIDSLLDTSICRHFGFLNEVEYSSAFVLDGVMVQGGPCSRNMTRFYFNSDVPISITENGKITNQSLSDVECEKCRCVLRIDYKSGEVEPEITAKLKGARHKFTVDDRFTVTLTGAIEIEVPEFKLPISNDNPKYFSKRRLITYWFLRLTSRNVIYTFRVAFRKDNIRTECNIECEDIISPYQFALIFDLLYKYYSYMYFTNNRCVCPLQEKPVNVPDLNAEQKQILQSIELVDERVQPIVPPPTPQTVSFPEQVDLLFAQFVKALGVESYRNFDCNFQQCIDAQPPYLERIKLQDMISKNKISEDFPFIDDENAFDVAMNIDDSKNITNADDR